MVGGGRGRWFLELVGPNYGGGYHCDGFYCPSISACWLRDEQHVSAFRAGMSMLAALTGSGPVYAYCPACALQLRTREAGWGASEQHAAWQLVHRAWAQPGPGRWHLGHLR